MSVPARANTVGLSELKTHFGDYLRRVQAGATLTITERGKPVGRLVPVRETLEEKLGDLLESNLIAWSGHKLESVQPPAQARGARTVADLLLEDRG